MDLCAAVDGLRQGRLRSVELVREAIAKARLVQLRHHCFLHIDAEGAMAAAEMAGRPPPPFELYCTPPSGSVHRWM